MRVTINIDSQILGDIDVTAESRYYTMADDHKKILEGLIDEALGKIRRAYELDPTPAQVDSRGLVETMRKAQKAFDRADPQ